MPSTEATSCSEECATNCLIPYTVKTQAAAKLREDEHHWNVEYKDG